MEILDINAMDNLLAAVENDTLSVREKQQIGEFFQNLKLLWVEKNMPCGSVFTNKTKSIYYYILGITESEIFFISYSFLRNFNLSILCNSETLDYFIMGIRNDTLFPSSLEALTNEFSSFPFKVVDNIAAIAQRAATEIAIMETKHKA